MLWIVVSRFSFVLSFPAFFGSHLSLLSAMKTMRIPFYRQFSDVDTVLSCLVFFFRQRNRVFGCLLFGQAALVFSEFIFNRVRPKKK